MSQIDLNRLSPHGREKLDLSIELDLSRLRLSGGAGIPEPVGVNASVSVDLAGVVWLEYTATAVLAGPCARCLEPVSCEESVSIRRPVALELSDENAQVDWVTAPEGRLDLAETVAEDLALQPRGVLLCREDCAGLCPKCGTNRNSRDCGCDLRQPDPRFAILRGLTGAEEAEGPQTGR